MSDHGSADGQAFEGVRVIFPDGAANLTLELRAAYADKPFCFMQTVNAIVDKRGDSELMLFMTAYLRSKLARYALFYTSFALSMDRPHVKLKEIEKLPFTIPEHHKDPQKAKGIVREVAQRMKGFQQSRAAPETSDWKRARAELDELVFDYFELTATERKVVSDTCDFVIPSRLPNTLRQLKLQLFQAPAASDYATYVKLLRSELDTWRDRFQGEGRFDVDVVRPESRSGAMSVVRVALSPAAVAKGSTTHTAMPTAVQSVLDTLRGSDPFPRAGVQGLTMASDLLVYHEGDYFFVKPMVKRLWLATAAAQDAWRIVQLVREQPVGVVH